MLRKRRESRAAAAPASAPPDWRCYDTVAEVYERVRAPLHEPPARDLIAAVAPPPGARILDVGAGTGVAARAAAHAVGPGGVVVAVDRSPGMLARAREGGTRLVVVGEAIDLPFPDAAFDALVASFVIFTFPKYETAMFDMLRVLRPGGRFGATTWAAGDDEFTRAWRDIAESMVGKELLRDAVQRAAPWRERFGDPARLEETLRDLGLRNVHVERRQYRTSLSQADYLLGRETMAQGRYLREMLGPALWERFRERAAETFRARFPDPLGDTENVLIAVGAKP